MPAIFDSIPNEVKENFIKAGYVYKMNLSQAEGITPKYANQISRDKYFVVIGKDTDNNAIGFLLINSKINQNISPELKKNHYPINVNKYDFLSHNSHVDCNHIKTISKAKFISNTCVPLGEIESDDLGYILNTVKESETIQENDLRRFNLI